MITVHITEEQSLGLVKFLREYHNELMPRAKINNSQPGERELYNVIMAMGTILIGPNEGRVPTATFMSRDDE